MGFFSGLDAEKYDRQYTDRELVGRIADNFKPQRKRIIVISLLVMLMAFLTAAVPFAIS